MRASVVLLAAISVACGSSASPDQGPLRSPPDSSPELDAAVDGLADATTPPDASSEGAPDVGVAPVDASGGYGEGGSPPRLMAYASGYGPDIQWLSVSSATGAMAPAGSVAAFGAAPSFLAVDATGTHLYAVDENATGRVGAYAIDAATGALTFQNAVSSGGNGPPYVGLDRSGKWVLVANYGDGTVSVIPVQPDGSLGVPAQTLAAGTESHMIATDPSNRYAFVPCKGADYVAQYLFDATTGTLTPNATPHVAAPSGTGPRHITFHPMLSVAYVVNETASTVTSYAFDPGAGTLTPSQTLSTVPGGFSGTNTGAEIHVHPSGKWLLASNRGADDVVVFALDASGVMSAHAWTASGGTTPRDFSLDPSGTLLYVANQGTGNVVPFRFDAASGALTALTADAGAPVSVPSASFVGFVALP